MGVAKATATTDTEASPARVAKATTMTVTTDLEREVERDQPHHLLHLERDQVRAQPHLLHHHLLERDQVKALDTTMTVITEASLERVADTTDLDTTDTQASPAKVADT